MDPIKYFQENQYIYIPQLISKDITNFLYNYYILKSCTNKNFSDEGGRENDGYMRYAYGDVCSETLLGILNEKLSVITQKKLCPTYSYARVYLHGEILKPHLDRPSCQYSTTINIGGDPWSIYMGKPNKDKELENGYSILNEITMNPGDGVIYMGEDLVHWRNKFQGDHCVQVFCHYIDENGPHYPEWKYDKRKNINYLKHKS